MPTHARSLGVLAVLAFASMGADAEGCSAELESDGNAESWEFGEIPEATEPLPMTCEFVEGDNCWTAFAEQFGACTPAGEAMFDADRTACEYADGSRIEWDGSVDVPSSGIHVPIIEHRFLEPDGSPCMTAKFLGIAHVALDVGGDVTVLHADSLTTFELICPDGRTYRNDVEGTCPDLGARWLAHELPGYDVVCDADAAACEFLVNGSGDPGEPRQRVTSCGF